VYRFQQFVPKGIESHQWVSHPVASETQSIGLAVNNESEHDCWMIATAFLFVGVLCDYFKSRRRLEAEILVL
jgi:hypothetical protein